MSTPKNKKKKKNLKFHFHANTLSERFKKWQQFGKRTTETRGEWTRQRLELIRDFDTRVYELGLKHINKTQ